MSGLMAGLASALQTAAQAAADSALMARPLAKQLHGAFWTWVTPIGIFLIAAWATLALYLHFARKTGS